MGEQDVSISERGGKETLPGLQLDVGLLDVFDVHSIFYPLLGRVCDGGLRGLI